MGLITETYQKHVRQNHILEIKQIVRTICKDGIVSNAEKNRLYNEGQKYYFSEEELDYMISVQMENNREHFLEETLPELIDVACHDTIITVTERQGLYDKAKVWNVSEDEVDVLIEQGLSRQTERNARVQIATETAANIVSSVASGIGSVFKGVGGFVNKMVDKHYESKAVKTNPSNDVPPINSASKLKKAYMLAVEGKQYGPFSIEQLNEMIPSKQFTEHTLVWTSGMPSWVAANQVQELSLLFAPSIPTIPTAPGMPPIPEAPQAPQMPE